MRDRVSSVCPQLWTGLVTLLVTLERRGESRARLGQAGLWTVTRPPHYTHHTTLFLKKPDLQFNLCWVRSPDIARSGTWIGMNEKYKKLDKDKSYSENKGMKILIISFIHTLIHLFECQ